MFNSNLMNTLNNVQLQIATYVPLVIVPIGLLGNIMNILVCARKPIRKETMGFYYSLMSLFNIPALIVGFIATYPATSNRLYASNFDCIAILYTFRIGVQMYAWLNVMAAWDRMMCVTFPIRFKFIYERKFLYTAASILFIFVLLINTPNFFFKIITITSPVDNSTQIFCTTSISNLVLARDAISQLMRTVLPFILELILNVILIHKLIQSRKRTHVIGSLKREYKFAFTIVVLNFAFILTSLPLLISIVYLNLLNYQFKSQTSSETLFVANFFYSIAILFASFMPITTFFVNIACNKLFRHEFCAMLCCKKR